jgi:hypothetical protein
MAIGQVLTKITNITNEGGSNFTKYKGFFTTLNALQSNHPAGEAGDFAFIQERNMLATWDENIAGWNYEKQIDNDTVDAIKAAIEPDAGNQAFSPTIPGILNLRMA